MKVQQLIDFLKKCNPEVEVKFHFDDGYFVGKHPGRRPETVDHAVRIALRFQVVAFDDIVM